MRPLLAPLLLVPSAAVPGAQELPFGWYVAYRSGDVEVETHAPAAAFALDAGQTVHPRIDPAAAWEARYVGDLSLVESGRYRFALEQEGGEASLRVDVRERQGEAQRIEELATEGAALAEGVWHDLGAVELRLRVRYARGEGERARLRVLWEMEEGDRKGFRREPVLSRRVAVPDALAAAARTGLRERAGFVLLERKRCAACHAAPEGAAIEVPPAPDLSRAGARMPGPWMSSWMRDPARMRPGTDMPSVLENKNRASLIASYLTGLASPEDRAADVAAPEGEPRAGSGSGDAAVTAADVEEGRPVAGDPAEGRELYHLVGCVACHGALVSPAAIHDDPFLGEEVPARAPFPFGDVARKWTEGELARYLADPAAVHPDGRMPGHALSADECADLAAYLVGEWGAGEPFLLPEPNPRARTTFVFSRCHACHATGEELLPVRREAPLVELDPERGCLDPADERSPRYDLTAGERSDLRRALVALGTPRHDPAPLDAAERTLALHRCGACHSRNGLGGVDEDLRLYFRSAYDEVDLGDEGRLPPDLTAVGFRLTTPWLRETLLGTGRARPYVGARMPHFGAPLEGLAEGLARLEGVFPDTDVEEPEVTDELVRTGRSLMGRDALGCIACHGYADYPPAGSPGLDMTDFAARLRYEGYRAFLPDPARYEPGTRMPAFGRGGVSTLKRVLEGDLHAQSDALWAYFSLGEGMPPPAGLEAPTDLQIEVGERPVVLRTFLEGAGSRAIAVGAPSGVHVAFDAGRCTLAQVWEGEFLDASGAWAGRGGTPARGRGPLLWSAGEGAGVRLAGSDAEPRFRGYRLDPEGWPTFEYTLGGVHVRERYEQGRSARSVVRRRLAIEGAGEGDALLLAAGPDVRPTGVESGTCVAVPGSGPPNGDAPNGGPPNGGPPIWRLEPEGGAMTLVLEVAP